MKMSDRGLQFYIILLVGISVVGIGIPKIVQHIRWSIDVSEPYSYTVMLPQNHEPLDLNQGFSFAFSVAKKWDANAKMTSMGWLSKCSIVQSTIDKRMGFSFVSTKFHFGLPRMFHQNIDIDPSKMAAEVVVMKILNKKWERRLLDLPEIESMPIDFNQALRIARQNSGSQYESAHPSCFVRSRLQEGYWFFAYSSDEYGGHDPLDLQVDGESGVVQDITSQTPRLPPSP